MTNGQAVFTPESPGVYTALVQVMDAAGHVTETETAIALADPNDADRPFVRLDDDKCFDAWDLYPIHGVVADNSGFFYKLQCREKGADEWITFHQGSGVTLEGELGVFDPTVLRNGIHEIRLYAQDLNGNVGENRDALNLLTRLNNYAKKNHILTYQKLY